MAATAAAGVEIAAATVAARAAWGGGMGAPGMGAPGMGAPGMGGPGFGGFGGGFGGDRGGDRGGFGGFGGGSFSPIDMLRRFDRNGNNMLDPDEMEGPARFFVDRMAQNNPRIDVKRAIPLDRLAEEMDRMRQDRMGGTPGMPGAPGTTTTAPKEPEPLVPGFDKVEEKPAVPGFGVPDENASIKVEERDLREADDRLRRYDTNKDGVLSKEEMANSRWSDDPMQYDRNRDGKLTKTSWPCVMLNDVWQSRDRTVSLAWPTRAAAVAVRVSPAWAVVGVAVGATAVAKTAGVGVVATARRMMANQKRRKINLLAIAPVQRATNRMLPKACLTGSLAAMPITMVRS